MPWHPSPSTALCASLALAAAAAIAIAFAFDHAAKSKSEIPRSPPIPVQSDPVQPTVPTTPSIPSTTTIERAEDDKGVDTDDKGVAAVDDNDVDDELADHRPPSPSPCPSSFNVTHHADQSNHAPSISTNLESPPIPSLNPPVEPSPSISSQQPRTIASIHHPIISHSSETIIKNSALVSEPIHHDNINNDVAIIHAPPSPPPSTPSLSSSSSSSSSPKSSNYTLDINPSVLRSTETIDTLRQVNLDKINALERQRQERLDALMRNNYKDQVKDWKALARKSGSFKAPASSKSSSSTSSSTSSLNAIDVTCSASTTMNSSVGSSICTGKPTNTTSNDMDTNKSDHCSPPRVPTPPSSMDTPSQCTNRDTHTTTTDRTSSQTNHSRHSTKVENNNNNTSVESLTRTASVIHRARQYESLHGIAHKS